MSKKYTITLSNFDYLTLISALYSYREDKRELCEICELDGFGADFIRFHHERMMSADTLYHLFLDSGEVVSDADN